VIYIKRASCYSTTFAIPAYTRESSKY